MVKIKPFRGIRPPQEYAAEVASRPYDVLNSVEAKAEATERSLLHIIKPEIDFDPIADEHSEEVYQKAMDNFRLWKERGWLQQDAEEHYYIYAQTMNGRTQYGIAMCCHFEDYLSGAIKKHELTRTEKVHNVHVQTMLHHLHMNLYHQHATNLQWQNFVYLLHEQPHQTLQWYYPLHEIHNHQ